MSSDLPASYSSNLSALVGSLLKKNARNRPSIQDLLYYDDTIVKAGVTLLGRDLYQKLIAAKKRIINEVDWFRMIKSNKLLNSYMQAFIAAYRAPHNFQALIHSTAEMPHERKIAADDVVEYGDADMMYLNNREASETGDLRKRLEANMLRLNENQINHAKINRITKKNTDDGKRQISQTKVNALNKDSPVKYLKDYDLDNYYKTAHPSENLPKVKRNIEIPEFSNIELSED